MANLCKGVSLPPMTVPFNLIDLLLFICLPSAMLHLAPVEDLMSNGVEHSTDTISNSTLPSFNSTGAVHLAAELPVQVDWLMVFALLDK